jgi:hypothetical protein
MATAHEIFDPLVAEHLERPGVDVGRMFGTQGLRVRGKMYAFIGHDGELIVKLPSGRIDALATEGDAVRMVMRGRELREWVAVDPDGGTARLAPLLAEAHDFVDRITP